MLLKNKMHQYEFDCNKCDIGYILKNYIKPLIQTLTNDIKNYYMRLLTTKCLNTAVMLAIFMVGKNQALRIANYCDTEATRQRHQEGKDNNKIIINKLRRDILRKNVKNRWLYYVLLTDGKFQHVDSEPIFFPGHVFILEKIPGETEPSYYFYQSYINEYDLQNHIKRNNKTLKISHARATEIINDLDYIFNARIWDKKCVKHWKDFTFIDSSQLLNYNSQNNFHICYKKTKLKDCLKYIKQYTYKKLKEIKPVLHQKSNKIYGDSSLYDESQSPLTYKEVYDQLLKLRDTINIANKYKCQKKSQT